ncbi:hypothetical protein NST63_24260 [Heyndrickxia sp. FSL W8-0496]
MIIFMLVSSSLAAYILGHSNGYDLKGKDMKDSAAFVNSLVGERYEN